jgi:hypothetical protein
MLGMTRRQLMANIDAAELALWRALLQLEHEEAAEAATRREMTRQAVEGAKEQKARAKGKRA